MCVVWDEHEERYKPCRDVCAEASRHDFGDWSDRFEAAPPITLTMMKNILRSGGDPIRWKDDRLREINMGKLERTAIEVGLISTALQYFGAYDQVNLPCLAGV